jgi:dihydrofolate reductase
MNGGDLIQSLLEAFLTRHLFVLSSHVLLKDTAFTPVKRYRVRCMKVTIEERKEGNLEWFDEFKILKY